MDTKVAPPAAPDAEAREQLTRLIGQLRETVRSVRGSTPLDLEGLRAGVRPLVGQLLADPDTLPWLLATRFSLTLLNRRAIGCMLLLGLFGRRLGFGRRVLEELMLGGLLMDIGKVSVPVGILARPGKLTPIEMGYVYRHVDQGLALARLAGPVSGQLAAILGSHHERLDGSGYPEGLQGTHIPLAARMAAIVDSYDAMTLDRTYAAGMAPASALQKIEEGRGRVFDAALADEFIRAIGRFPTGSWLRLPDGELAVVREQLPDDPDRPVIALVCDRDGLLLGPPAHFLRLNTGSTPATGLGPAESVDFGARFGSLLLAMH